MSRHVGVDLTAIDEVRDSIARFGDRYLTRVFTAAEREQTGDDPRRLAECFAAKEATLKALGAAELPSPGSVALHRAPGGLSIVLSEAAQEMAGREGIGQLDVAVTHARRHALAIALGREDG